MNISKHPLKPDETIHKILISTTSRMVGEFVSDDILISHAWQNFTNSSVPNSLDSSTRQALSKVAGRFLPTP